MLVLCDILKTLVTYEKQLAEAVMNGETKIELTDKLVGGCEKIMAPSDIVWASILSALVASILLGGACGFEILLGVTILLPTVPSVCSGVGSAVFVIGAQGTLCAFRWLVTAQTMDVLTELRANFFFNEKILAII